MIDTAAAGRLRPKHEQGKRNRAASRAMCFFLVLLASLNSANAQSSEVLSLDAHIPLPDVKGRIDHFSVDIRGQRLFVAAVENHSLEVINLKSGQRVHTITDLAEPQGAFYDPATNHLFVACGLDGVTKIFDGDSFQVLATVKLPDDADNIRYDPRSWLEVFGQHRKVGPNFNPEVGFLERNDCICDYADVTFKPRPKLRGVRELNFEGFIFHAPDTNHVLETQEWQNTFRIEFNNGAYSDDDIVDVFTQRLTTPFNIYKNVFIPVGEYHWTRHQLTYGSSQERKLMVSLFERFGMYYDGRLNESRIRGTYRANERLSFSLAEQWNRFRVDIVSDSSGNLLPPSSGNFSVVFGSFQTNYSFSRFLTLSALRQMDTANTQAASANIRLRWNYRPDSDLFFIYTAGQRFASLVAANPPQYYENRFAIKFTYSWRP